MSTKQRNIFYSLLSGFTATVIAFIIVQNWEEDKRQQEFNIRAQAHTSAIQSQLEYISKQMEDIRFLIEYDINKEHESKDQPSVFMNMVAPLITHEPALIDIAWAVQVGDSKQARILYSWSKHTPKEDPHITSSNRLLTGTIHLTTQQRYELQLVSPIFNKLHPIINDPHSIVHGKEIAALITEWDIAKLIELGLKNTPVSAQDIAFFAPTSSQTNEQIYFHPSRSRTAEDKDTVTDVSYTDTFEFAGLVWKIIYTAAPRFLTDSPIILAWQILLMGVLLTLMLAWYLYNRGLYTEKVEQKVLKKTKKLRKSEQHFRSIINGLQDIYYRTDLEGRILTASPSMINMGYKSKDVIGTNISDYYSDKSARHDFLQALSNSSDGKVFNYHISALHKDGSIRWLSSNSQFVYNDEGHAIGIEGTLRDFTESKALSEKVQNMDRLESLGVLAGGIAHDFNNILTSILGNASIARMEIDDKSTLVPYLDHIEKASLSAADLCKQMLAYAGKGKYFIKPIDLAETVSDISQLIQTSVEKNIRLEYESYINTPPIDADSAQIQQLVMNLITNAAESYLEQPGVVEIKVGMQEMNTFDLNHYIEGESLPEGSYVYIEVVDQGCGIDDATMLKIFEPFFTTKFTGRGLGLSATRGILRSHHGALSIQSKQGEGTTIRAYFPASQHVIKKEKPSSPTQQESAHILLIDDEPQVQSVVRLMLEELGHNVTVAVNGQKGITAFQSNPNNIDLVILDMTMPDMDGKACFIALKAIQDDVCVLLSSGYSKEETTKDFPEGLSGFLQKPYTLKVLAKSISEVLK